MEAKSEEEEKGTVVELGKIDLNLIDDKLVELKRLSEIGSGYWLYLPKPWVELLCTFKDGSYWVQYEQQGNTIVVKADKYTERG